MLKQTVSFMFSKHVSNAGEFQLYFYTSAKRLSLFEAIFRSVSFSNPFERKLNQFARDWKRQFFEIVIKSADKIQL